MLVSSYYTGQEQSRGSSNSYWSQQLLTRQIYVDLYKMKEWACMYFNKIKDAIHCFDVFNDDFSLRLTK